MCPMLQGSIGRVINALWTKKPFLYFKHNFSQSLEQPV